jgi:hypothetical protein
LPYVLFGGFESGRKPELQDTWTLKLGEDQNSLATASWSLIQLKGRLPSARAGHVLSPGVGGKVQLFGGGNFDWERMDQKKETFLMRAILPVSDIHWEYDVAEQTWTELPEHGAPSARSFAGFTSGKGKRSGLMFLFGGVDGNGNPLQDTWQYEITSSRWTELTTVLTGRPPSPRFGMGFVCDDYGDPFILGGMGGNTGSVDLYKVPLPSYATDVPQTRSDWIDLYDGDTIVGKEDDPVSELTGVIHLCAPLGSPVYPCSVKIQGQVLGWRAMLRCDGSLGCHEILFEEVHFECNTVMKELPTFEASAGASISVSNSYIVGCSSHASGGFVRAYDRATVTVDGSTIRACQSSGSGGAIAIHGSALLISGSVFDKCTAAGYGGAVWADIFVSLPLPAVVSTISIDQTAFLHCASGQDGGAMSVSGGSLSLENCVFESNVASGSGGGGALNLDDASSVIVFEIGSEAGEAVQNNQAHAGGGGVLVEILKSQLPSYWLCDLTVVLTFENFWQLWQGTQPRIYILCAPGAEPLSSGCSPCAPGMYKETGGTSPCQPCEPGSFAASEGTAVCTQCPASFFSTTVGSNTSDACLPCPQVISCLSGSLLCSLALSLALSREPESK